jgi:ketosteroid isomerase-like protein
VSAAAGSSPTSNHDLDARIAALERRVQAAEDELAIRNLIVRYGLAVDLGDAQGVADVFTPDAEFEVGSASIHLSAEDIVFRGREQIKRDLVLGPHQALLPNCAHTIGPVIVRLSQDRAEATGYSRIYLRREKGQPDDHIHLIRLAFNRWKLEKQSDGSWLISHRTARVLGEDGAQALFRQGLSADPSPLAPRPSEAGDPEGSRG